MAIVTPLKRNVNAWKTEVSIPYHTEFLPLDLSITCRIFQVNELEKEANTTEHRAPHRADHPHRVCHPDPPALVRVQDRKGQHYTHREALPL